MDNKSSIIKSIFLFRHFPQLLNLWFGEECSDRQNAFIKTNA